MVSTEKLFFSINAKTAMQIAEVRGVIKATSAQNGLSVVEIHPLTLKKTLVGTGKATKKEMQTTIKRIFNIQEKFKTDDVADAVGIAYVGMLEALGQL